MIRDSATSPGSPPCAGTAATSISWNFLHSGVGSIAWARGPKLMIYHSNSPLFGMR